MLNRQSKVPESVDLKVWAMHLGQRFRGGLALLWANLSLNGILFQPPGLHMVVTEDHQTTLLSSFLMAHLPHMRGGKSGSVSPHTKNKWAVNFSLAHSQLIMNE